MSIKGFAKKHLKYETRKGLERILPQAIGLILCLGIVTSILFVSTARFVLPIMMLMLILFMLLFFVMETPAKEDVEESLKKLVANIGTDNKKARDALNSLIISLNRLIPETRNMKETTMVELRDFYDYIIRNLLWSDDKVMLGMIKNKTREIVDIDAVQSIGQTLEHIHLELRNHPEFRRICEKRGYEGHGEFNRLMKTIDRKENFGKAKSAWAWIQANKFDVKVFNWFIFFFVVIFFLLVLRWFGLLDAFIAVAHVLPKPV